jgi:YHS domain-containing protein
MERDVVCGMQVDPAKAAGTSEYGGKTYYLCGKGCKAKFDLDPGRYAGPGLGTRDSGFEKRGPARIPNPESRIPAGSPKWT